MLWTATPAAGEPPSCARAAPGPSPRLSQSSEGQHDPAAGAYPRSVDQDNLLGEFLHARRELVHPEEVGLPVGQRRRVAGLRREEVASLAGISTEYYVRLEQGRDRHPSEQVVDAIADALRLDVESKRHAFELARDRSRQRKFAGARAEKVPAGVQMLLSTMNVPAFVLNRYRDVLAVNDLATAMEPSLVVGSNRLVSLFTDPAARAYHPDLDANTASVVAQLRADIGTDDRDPRYQALVGELSLRSEQFRRLWARHDVRIGGSDSAIVEHPEWGEIRLRREKLAMVGTDLVLVIYHADPGSRSADVIARQWLAMRTGAGEDG
ncbi:XRE family transcriptional regulator [Labedella phragmitis]|uniref:XRE family transcriptional regulator n=1 Tax=Labedella phragmitis TaxID=2498849 RepID=A0A3S4BBG4_9MICO|nr:XRE family transcriptional regulator [Labedella phragmitis]